jgi:hypothetical protein
MLKGIVLIGFELVFAIVTSVNCSIAGGMADNGWSLLILQFPAFFSALATGFGALLTMLRFTFGAFIAACLTNLGA